MNVLFITMVWPEQGEHNLYSDLMEEFKNAQHSVFIVGIREKRTGKYTTQYVDNGRHVLLVRCGNLQKTSAIKKGISLLFLGRKVHSAIKKYFVGKHFDLMLYATPPITWAGTLKKLKKKFHAKSYLLLKDLWPQGPVDLGAIKKGGLIWQYFRHKEKLLYRISDYIGCMSPANVQYLLKNNPSISSKKVEECPNSILSRGDTGVLGKVTREEWGIPKERVVFLFGGNLGKPQGVDFLIEAAGKIQHRKDILFIVVGSGTEYRHLEKQLKSKVLENVRLHPHLQQSQYEALCRSCDVGLILLNSCFTIPNFPSRLLTYLDIGMPVLCATDGVCDMGDIVEAWHCGMKVLHGDVKSFLCAVEQLAENEGLRKQMAHNATRLLEERYVVKQSYEIITRHFEGLLSTGFGLKGEKGYV